MNTENKNLSNYLTVLSCGISGLYLLLDTTLQIIIKDNKSANLLLSIICLLLLLVILTIHILYYKKKFKNKIIEFLNNDKNANVASCISFIFVIFSFLSKILLTCYFIK